MTFKRSIIWFQIVFLLVVSGVLSGFSDLRALMSHPAEPVIVEDTPDQARPADHLSSIKVFEVFTLAGQPDSGGQGNSATTPELWPIEEDGTELEQAAMLDEASPPLKIVKRFAFSNLGRSAGPPGVSGDLALAEGSNRYLILSLEVSGLARLGPHIEPIEIKEAFNFAALPHLDRYQQTRQEFTFSNDPQAGSPAALNGKLSFSAGDDPHLLLDLEVMPLEAAN